MIYPLATYAPPAHKDMPPEVKGLYDEAGQIAMLSPRAAAALLRAAIDKLCVHVGCNLDQKLDEKITEVIAQAGLPKEYSDAMHILRLVGNSALHPSEINLDEALDTPELLFEFVNLIVDRLITFPRNASGFLKKVATPKQLEHIEDLKKKTQQ